MCSLHYNPTKFHASIYNFRCTIRFAVATLQFSTKHKNRLLFWSYFTVVVIGLWGDGMRCRSVPRSRTYIESGITILGHHFYKRGIKKSRWICVVYITAQLMFYLMIAWVGMHSSGNTPSTLADTGVQLICLSNRAYLVASLFCSPLL